MKIAAVLFLSVAMLIIYQLFLKSGNKKRNTVYKTALFAFLAVTAFILYWWKPKNKTKAPISEQIPQLSKKDDLKRVYVQLPSGEKISLDVKSSDTMKEIKEKVKQKINMRDAIQLNLPQIPDSAPKYLQEFYSFVIGKDPLSLEHCLAPAITHRKKIALQFFEKWHPLVYYYSQRRDIPNDVSNLILSYVQPELSKNFTFSMKAETYLQQMVFSVHAKLFRNWDRISSLKDLDDKIEKIMAKEMEYWRMRWDHDSPNFIGFKNEPREKRWAWMAGLSTIFLFNLSPPDWNSDDTRFWHLAEYIMKCLINYITVRSFEYFVNSLPDNHRLEVPQSREYRHYHFGMLDNMGKWLDSDDSIVFNV